MVPKYEIGQKVIIKPVKDDYVSPRDSSIEPYAGQVGEVTNYYWISPSAGDVFCMYSVRVSPDIKEIMLYEDEIKEYKE